MKYCFAALLLALQLQAFAQTLTYDAILRGHKVGEMEVVQEVSDNKTAIVSNTHIEAHLLFSITLDIEINSTYVDGVLVESQAQTFQNGKLHSSTMIHKADQGYRIDNDGIKSTLNKDALIGADLLYFEEPSKIKEALALVSGEYLTIDQDTDDLYFFIHDGKKEKHRYDNGELEEVVIDHKLYTVTLKKQKK